MKSQDISIVHKKYHHTQPRHPFTKVEDELLFSLCKDQNEIKWKVVASHFKDRTPRQCRERYNHYVRPDVTNSKWTKEEELLLKELVEQHGTKWSVIATFFHELSDNNLNNRWYKHIFRINKRQQKTIN